MERVGHKMKSQDLRKKRHIRKNWNGRRNKKVDNSDGSFYIFPLCSNDMFYTDGSNTSLTPHYLHLSLKTAAERLECVEFISSLISVLFQKMLYFTTCNPGTSK